MRTSRCVLIVALVFVSNVFLSTICLSNLGRSGCAAAQSSLDRETDQVAAERVLGPRWKQLSRRAGMIFAGTVLATATPTATSQNVTGQNATSQNAAADHLQAGAVPRATPGVQLSFRVDEAIAGVEPGQVLTIHEWAGAWSMHRPMSKGQHILIFLYPPSRVGLTSPVGGSLGQVALDPTGKNVSQPEKPNVREPDANSKLQDASSPRPRVTVAGGNVTGNISAVQVSVVQLERAIRSAREE